MSPKLLVAAVFAGTLLMSASAAAASPPPQLVPASDTASMVPTATSSSPVQVGTVPTSSGTCAFFVGLQVLNYPHYQVAQYSSQIDCPAPAVEMTVSTELQRSGSEYGVYTTVAGPYKDICYDAEIRIVASEYQVHHPIGFGSTGLAAELAVRQGTAITSTSMVAALVLQMSLGPFPARTNRTIPN